MPTRLSAKTLYLLMLHRHMSMRTGEISGFKYTVALPDKAFEKLTVKIDGECKLEKPDDRHYPVVIFDGLEMRPYWTPEGYKVSATAKNIRAVNAGKA